jgi:hypothetical protein
VQALGVGSVLGRDDEGDDPSIVVEHGGAVGRENTGTWLPAVAAGVARGSGGEGGCCVSIGPPRWSSCQLSLAPPVDSRWHPVGMGLCGGANPGAGRGLRLAPGRARELVAVPVVGPTDLVTGS